MKTTSAILLVASVLWVAASALAQGDPAADGSGAAAAERVASGAEVGEGGRLLVVSLEDRPLEIIMTLVEQSRLKVAIDERILEGRKADGHPLPGWGEAVSARWEHVTAREALEQFLERYGLQLAPYPGTDSHQVTFKPAAPAVPPSTSTEATSPTATPMPAPALEAAGGGPSTAESGAEQEGMPIEEEVVPVVNLEDQLVTDAITMLARQANLNFQFDPRVLAGVDLEGKPAPYLTNLVSVRWEKVTPTQALESLLANYNLMLEHDPKTQIARVTFRPPPALEPLVTKVVQLQFANPTNMVTVLKTTLSERSQVTPDVRTSSLVISTTEKELELVDAVLSKLDTPTRQILIEAKILETAKNPKTVKGINWAGTLDSQNITFGNGRTTGQAVSSYPGAPATTTTTLPSGRSVTSTTQPSSTTETRTITDIGLGALGPLASASPGVSANTAQGLHPAVAFLNADGLKVALSFLNSDTDTEVVATPRAVTLDNELARLSVTRLFPNFKITPGTQTTPAGAEITYTNLGMTLEVTPRIAGTNLVNLRVVPEVGNVDSVDRKTINGTVNEANIYAIRRIETRVIIPSGNTLVMGGLISDNQTRAYTKVPILGDIPGLGLAFRHESKQRSRSNLLIFLTPTIIQETDFQPLESSGFLQTRPEPDKPLPPVSAWDSGKPRWGRADPLGPRGR